MDLECAAAALGVHYQTVYRWVRAGLLPAVKIGSEYEIDPADVARFGRTRAARASNRPRATGLEHGVQALAEALSEGNEALARSVVQGINRSGMPPIGVCDTLVLPAWSAVEDRRARALLSPAQRRLAMAICERLVGLLVFPLRSPPRGVAVVAGAEGTDERLPGLLATVALQSDDWWVHDLGPNVPARDILDFARERQPGVILMAAPRGHQAACDPRAAIQAELAAPVLRYEPGLSLTELVAMVERVTSGDCGRR